jgi:pimeloyl-ACP methyl ester carboxylesterase
LSNVGGVNVKPSGAGRKAVVVHGFGADSESWQGMLSHLKCPVEALPVDLRGHGDSGKTHREYSFEVCAEDFLAVVDEALGAL